MRHSLTHGFAVVLATAAVALVAAAPPASAASICGEGTYAYAGFDPGAITTGVSATIEQAGAIDVRDGHVAGWIGVVAPDISDGWLQVGLSALPGDTTSRVYYEVEAPGGNPVYHELRSDIASATPYRFAVLELRQRPGWWRVWVDGRPATAPIHLRGSHGRWSAQAVGESWAGTTSGSCNSYAYGFGNVALHGRGRSRLGLAGAVFHDRDYVVAHRSHSSFVAMSVGD